jgi:lipopolysaccharide export system protein LptA
LLTGFDTNKGGSCLLANVRVEENEYKVAAETVAIIDKKNTPSTWKPIRSGSDL